MELAIRKLIVLAALLQLASCWSDAAAEERPASGRSQKEPRECPFIGTYAAWPASDGATDSFVLTATPMRLQPGLGYRWTAEDGRFAVASASSTLYECERSGIVRVHVILSDGVCDDHAQLSVECAPDL